MPKPNKGPRLGGGPAHERLLLNNMATQLFTHKRIQTTETKAKRLQPIAERLITFAKRGDLAARRRVLRQITDKSAVHELFAEIAPLVENREGGYTRIVKTGFRKGDRAPLAVIELVLEPVNPKPRRAHAAEEVVVEDAVTEEVESTEAEAAAEAAEVDVPETEAAETAEVEAEAATEDTEAAAEESTDKAE